MNTYLYGACGNIGCLSCTPAYINEGMTDEQYVAVIDVTKIERIA